jgi:hypothetical protein
MPAKPRSRRPAATSCGPSGRFWESATDTTPAISATAVQRGRTPARITPLPKQSPATIMSAPWRAIHGRRSWLSAPKSLVPSTSA